MRFDTDVAVVGYGPVGALTALLLGRAGVSCVVLDRRDGVHPLPRAVAADDEVLRLLAAAGLGDHVARMLAVPGARFADRHGRTLLDLDFDGTDSAQPGLAMFRQPELEQALRDAVERTAVTPLLGADVSSLVQDASGVTLGLTDGSEVRAKFAVGSDGARSTVRDVLGVKADGPRDVQRWLVVDVLTEQWPPRPERVTYVCDPSEPTVTMPVPGGRRFEFLLPGGDPRRPRVEASLQEVEARLRPHLDGVPAVVERFATYEFRVRTAARWRVGRVLLAGDAAHTMPPFAGQGLAAGLRDAENAAWKLALVVGGRATDALLDTYEVERRPHLAKMIRLSRLAGALVSVQCHHGASARDAVLLAAARTPGLAGWLHRGGPRRSETVQHDGCPLKAHGSLVPNARVAWLGARGAALLDDVLAGQFALLGLGIEPAHVLPPDVTRMWDRMGSKTARVVLGFPEPGPALPGPAIFDVDGRLSQLGSPGDVLVVRPDRKLLVSGSADRVSAVSRAFPAVLDEPQGRPVPPTPDAPLFGGARGASPCTYELE